MGLQLDVHLRDEATAVLALRGRLDAVSAPALKLRIRALLDDGRRELVCDLAGLGFVDSSGLSGLVFGLEFAREHGGHLHVACASEQVAQSFRSTRLDRVFVLHPSVEAALREAG